MIQKKDKKEKIIVIFWVVALLGLWQLSAASGRISPLLLPGIPEVIRTLADSLVHGDLLYQLYFSLKVILLGICLSVVLAVLFALAAQKSLFIKGFCDVLCSIAHPLPSLALLPLIIIWFGTGDGSIIAIIVHSALWPILINLNTGFREVPEIYLNVGKNLGLSPFDIIFEIKLKSALPHLLSGVKIAFARSWRALIGAEMVFGALGLKGGIGWYIFKQRTFMNTPGLFAGILVIIIVGLLVESFLFGYIEKKTIQKWGSR